MLPFVPNENLEWFKQFTRNTGAEQMYAVSYFSSDSSSESFSDDDGESSVSKWVTNKIAFRILLSIIPSWISPYGYIYWKMIKSLTRILLKKNYGTALLET